VLDDLDDVLAIEAIEGTQHPFELESAPVGEDPYPSAITSS
jgi:hypothetical protein